MQYTIGDNGCFYVIDELCHYGVPGMKWGVRKKYPESEIASNYRNAKATRKSAKKAYNKSFNKAYNKAHQVYSLSKKKREANDKRWEDVYDKLDALDKAKADYNQAKTARKNAIKSTTRQINKNASLSNKLIYSDATRKKAAKYVVDNNMSVSEATKKAQGDAWRNTAAFVAGYAAIGAAVIYKSR